MILLVKTGKNLVDERKDKEKGSQGWLGGPSSSMNENFMGAHFRSILVHDLLGLIRGNKPIAL